MDRTKYLETWNKVIKSQKSSCIADVCNQFILPNFLCTWGFSEFIHKVVYVDLDTVIQNLFKNATFLLLMYQNNLKYNTRVMTISENPIMIMICGYTILIGKYYQQFILWMNTLVF